MGRTPTDENPRSGCLSVSLSDDRINEVHTMKLVDHCLTVCERGIGYQQSFVTCRSFMPRNFNRKTKYMFHLSAEFVLCLLSDDQKENYITSNRNFLTVPVYKKTIKIIITGDET